MIPEQDRELIETWLYGKKKTTVKVYTRTIEALFDHADKPLSDIKLIDLQRFKNTLTGSDNTIRLRVNAIRSLFEFAFKQGVISSNTAQTLKAPKPRDRIDEKILSEEVVHEIIRLTTKKRDKVLIKIMYVTGGRVAEICALKWKDIKRSKNGGQMTLFGKGDKTRTVKFSDSVWTELDSIRNNAAQSDPVFLSQKGGHIDPTQAWRIVRKAARRAGIQEDVSPHWFRHSHASHALNKGAPVTLVRDTLGHSNISITDRYAHSKISDSSSYYLE